MNKLPEVWLLTKLNNGSMLIHRALNARQETHGSKYHFLYSTPSCYAKALNDEGLEWPTKQDDFLPYASDYHAYWSGYYTSRPAIKRYERMGNNFLQVSASPNSSEWHKLF